MVNTVTATEGMACACVTTAFDDMSIQDTFVCVLLAGES